MQAEHLSAIRRDAEAIAAHVTQLEALLLRFGGRALAVAAGVPVTGGAR